MVRIHPFFWLFAFLIGWLNSTEPSQIFVWVFIILISVLIHECGHALAGIAFKQKVRIELVAFGGMTLREGPKLTLGKEFIVVLMGPLFGFLLCLLAFFLLPHIEDQKSLFYFGVRVSALVNLLWTVLNLIPVMPLDGGHLLRIVLEKLFGFKGVKATHFVSFILATLLTMASFAFGQIFLGVLFFMLAFASFRSLKEVRLMSVEDQDFKLQESFENAEKKLIIGKRDEALHDFEEIRQRTHEGMIYNIATETSALMMLEDPQLSPDKKKEIYRLLSTLPSVSQELIPTFHRLAFENGDMTKAVELADEAYQLQPTPDTALLNAMAYATKKLVTPAIGWLECALSESGLNFKEIISRKEFDPIREDPAFDEFIKGSE